MTDEELMAELRADPPSLRERVRRIFQGECGRLEQAFMQRVTPTPTEAKKMQFDAVDKIIAEIKPNGTAR